MVHLPAFVSNTRSVVPEYTTRFESSTIPYSSTTPSPLNVFAARHTPWYWGAVPGAFDVTSTVHSPTRKSNCDASGGGAFRAGPSCAADCTRSEERRVGKECRSRWSADHEKKKRHAGHAIWEARCGERRDGVGG